MQGLFVGVLPFGLIYKWHGKLLVGSDSIVDTVGNRVALEDRGARFATPDAVRIVARGIKRQRVLHLDCQTCGVCCAQRNDRSGMVIDGILESERDELDNKKHGCLGSDPRYGVVLRKQITQIPGIDACPFFCGEPGVKCGCSVYDERPAVCRYFHPACDDCLKIRDVFWQDCVDDPRSQQEKNMLDDIMPKRMPLPVVDLGEVGDTEVVVEDTEELK